MYLPICNPAGSFAQYNANNSWNFNGNNRVLNNNNRYNTNFRSRPSPDSNRYDNQSLFLYRKPVGIPLEEVVTLYQDCKSIKFTCVEFDSGLIRGLIEVCHKLNNNDIEIVEVRAFIVTIPKLREIIFCMYSDKLIQSFYVMSINTYLEDKWLLDNSFSCRQNKGVIKAVEKFQELVYQESNGYTRKDVWLTSFDIYHFFIRIDCELACELMMDFIRENLQNHPRKDLLIYLTRVLYLTCYQEHIITNKYCELHNLFVSNDKSLLHNPPHIGVPIGNWPSQIIGNFLTTFVLIYIKGLGYSGVHYTDDTALIIHDIPKWIHDEQLIEEFYKEKLHLLLHPDKKYLQHYSKGIQYLGRKLRFNRILPSDRTINSINELVNTNIELANLIPGYCEKYCEEFSRSLNSYLGLLRTMNSWGLRDEIIHRIMNSKWSEVFEFQGHYEVVWIKKKYKTPEKYKHFIRGSKLHYPFIKGYNW